MTAETTPRPDTAAAGEPESPWAAPELACDIVMKGGITSGVVYPGAVVELAKRYRFRSIGGASAGAIAAAAVAAAEYGRDAPGAGFGRLAAVPGELGGIDEQGRPFLLRLFQPERATRPLFETAMTFMRFGKGRGALKLLTSFPRFPLVALALALLAIALAAFAGVDWAIAIAVLAVTPWIAVVGALRDVAQALGDVAENDFGLCRLGPDGVGDGDALTVWLHRVIQEAAGRGDPLDRPLTFADLWGLPPLTGNETADELAERDKLLRLPGWNPRERKLDLQVMTTNLTNGRPLRLPIARDRYRDTAEDGGGLLFEPAEWLRFFPQAVVGQMIARSRPLEADTAQHLATLAPGRDLRYFPGGGELPVVVAARMSLSFPLLISAVPLRQLEYRAGGAQPRLRRVIFSDGGISSNFPVHFFDAPLPTRPTFALNLGSFPEGVQPDPANPALGVQDPPPVNDTAHESWRDIESMFKFFTSIKDAMQNWRDNAQARMPGFRDRVIKVMLDEGEGGLNLAMKEEKIAELSARGAYAGQRLTTLFSGDPAQPPQRTKQWNDHRFARLRITLAVLDRFHRATHDGYTAPGDPATLPFDQRLGAGDVAPYALTGGRLALAMETIAAYGALVAEWGDKTLDDADVPHPRAVLRTTPPV